MSAYLISEVEVLDPAEWARYREIALPTVTAFGGRYIVAGADDEVIEDDLHPEPPPQRKVSVIEFPDMEALRSWYSSDEYGEALAVRRVAARRRLEFVEGVA